MKLVMVCTGNTCRSPMAEALMRRALECRGAMNVEVESAGIYAVAGDFPSHEAIGEMKSRGLDISRHRAQNIRDVGLDGALTLCMTDAHLREVHRAAPGVQADTLMRYAGLEGQVPDPMGGGPVAYRKAADQMERAIEVIADKIAKDRG